MSTPGTNTATFVPQPDPATLTAPAQSSPRLPTTAAQSGQPAQAVSLVTDSRGNTDTELTALLHRRLRQLALLFLAAYAAFLLRDLLAPERLGLKFQKIVFLVIVPLQLVITIVAWSAWAHTPFRLRLVEMSVLGICWIAISSTQFDSFCHWDDLAFYLQGERGASGQVLVANLWIVPWFAVIAGYPVIVPNTVRRTFVLAGVMAILPFLVTAAAVLVSDLLSWGNTWMIFVQYAIWFPLAVGIASYGARQAGLLRAQAHAAKRFGQYRLTRKLGGGGMGEVYLAEHLLLRRPSVVKIIRPDRASDRSLLKRFEREVQILATLTHWNTVEVFDYGHTADGTFYYVMEYLPGLNLDELVQRYGPLPPGRVVHLLRQLCAALHEAHTSGLIHRDIKPGNVMVCRRGCVPDVVKLLDFGLVHSAPLNNDSGDAAKLTREGVVLGTPAYMSPEQAAGKPLDSRSDIYAFGATAFFLLTSKPVFQGGAMEVIAAHLMTPAPCPTEINAAVPPDVAGIVRRCLAKKPEERFSTIAELDAALAGCPCAADWDDRRAAEWWEAHTVGVNE